MGQNFVYRAGRASAEPFKVSGRPFLKRHKFDGASAGVLEEVIVFPSMAKSFTLVNEATNDSSVVFRVHFDTRIGNIHVVNTDGEGANIKVMYGESVSMDVKAAKVYISRDAYVGGLDTYFTLIAEVTGISSNDYVLSGSGINIF
jgi:hypothetical protein